MEPSTGPPSTAGSGPSQKRCTVPDMTWVAAVARLRARREPGVLVTVATVRGHAPRNAGAKLVVGRERTWGSIGGGNIEARSEEHTSELQSRENLVCRLLL